MSLNSNTSNKTSNNDVTKYSEKYNETKKNIYNSKSTKSNLKVIARVRPLNEYELEMQENNLGYISYEVKDDDTIIMINENGANSEFVFDKVYNHKSSQEEIYNCVGKETLNDVLDGYNGTIFTYGQSGSGKTYTLYGSDIYDDSEKGLIPRIM